MIIYTETDIMKVFFNKIETNIDLYRKFCFGKNVESNLYELENGRYRKITK